MKKLNKKGFTLAELLIVVAIIAVLTAIAVPLFVGALNKAEENVKEANIRAVRGIAVEEILLDETEKYKYEGTTKTEANLAKFWAVTAYVTKSGEVHDVKIVAHKDDPGTGTTCTKLKEAVPGTGEGPGAVVPNIAEIGEYEVKLVVSELEVE